MYVMVGQPQVKKSITYYFYIWTLVVYALNRIVSTSSCPFKPLLIDYPHAVLDTV